MVPHSSPWPLPEPTSLTPCSSSVPAKLSTVSDCVLFGLFPLLLAGVRHCWLCRTRQLAREREETAQRVEVADGLHDVQRGVRALGVVHVADLVVGRKPVRIGAEGGEGRDGDGGRSRRRQSHAQHQRSRRGGCAERGCDRKAVSQLARFHDEWFLLVGCSAVHNLIDSLASTRRVLGAFPQHPPCEFAVSPWITLRGLLCWRRRRLRSVQPPKTADAASGRPMAKGTSGVPSPGFGSLVAAPDRLLVHLERRREEVRER